MPSTFNFKPLQYLLVPVDQLKIQLYKYTCCLLFPAFGWFIRMFKKRIAAKVGSITFITQYFSLTYYEKIESKQKLTTTADFTTDLG